VFSLLVRHSRCSRFDPDGSL